MIECGNLFFLFGFFLATRFRGLPGDKTRDGNPLFGTFWTHVLRGLRWLKEFEVALKSGLRWL